MQRQAWGAPALLQAQKLCATLTSLCPPYPAGVPTRRNMQRSRSNAGGGGGANVLRLDEHDQLHNIDDAFTAQQMAPNSSIRVDRATLRRMKNAEVGVGSYGGSFCSSCCSSTVAAGWIGRQLHPRGQGHAAAHKEFAEVGGRCKDHQASACLRAEASRRH